MEKKTEKLTYETAKAELVRFNVEDGFQTENLSWHCYDGHHT